mgnify:CR=1 FL=1
MDGDNASPTTVPTRGAARGTARKSLDGLLEVIGDHITAIQDASRELLPTNADEEATVRIELTTGAPPAAHSASSDCWDAEYICGKGPSGYIKCTVRVCIDTGPVTKSE